MTGHADGADVDVSRHGLPDHDASRDAGEASKREGGEALKPCDLIMKGGITSGIVYPAAILELARDYRFFNIGGASAGAMAAACCAAAEYRRRTSPTHDDLTGFHVLDNIKAQIGENLSDLFHPTPRMRPLFSILMALVRRKKGQNSAPVLIQAIVKAYWPRIAAILLPTLLLAATAGFVGGIVEAVLIIVLGLGLALVSVLIGFYRDIMVTLPDGGHTFGLCSGLSDPSYGKVTKPGLVGRRQRYVLPAFTDWITALIDEIAFGEGGRETPLLMEDIKHFDIELATMTTDLASRRPYQLPFTDDLHWISEDDLKRLFPDKICQYVINAARKREAEVAGSGLAMLEQKTLYRLPVGDAMPVMMLARFSLSFPGLISAIPLYRLDKAIAAGKPAFRQCLFSDGGISSNFPIHFFDKLLPSRPTFGVTLADFEPERHGDRRVDLPTAIPKMDELPIASVSTLGGFLGAIVDTAKDWRDTLQSLLPGYAERIVTVRLDSSSEGGFNLDMNARIVDDLAGYGRQAGQALRTDFLPNEHRFRRVVSAMPEIENVAWDFSEKYAKGWPYVPEHQSWDDIFSAYGSTLAAPGEAWNLDAYHVMAKDVRAAGAAIEARDLTQTSIIQQNPGTLPENLTKPDVRFRLVASAGKAR